MGILCLLPMVSGREYVYFLEYFAVHLNLFIIFVYIYIYISYIYILEINKD